MRNSECRLLVLRTFSGLCAARHMCARGTSVPQFSPRVWSIRHLKWCDDRSNWIVVLFLKTLEVVEFFLQYSKFFLQLLEKNISEIKVENRGKELEYEVSSSLFRVSLSLVLMWRCLKSLSFLFSWFAYADILCETSANMCESLFYVCVCLHARVSFGCGCGFSRP